MKIEFVVPMFTIRVEIDVDVDVAVVVEDLVVVEHF